MQTIDWTLFHLVNQLAGHSRALDVFFKLCAQGLEYVLLLMVATLWVTPGENDTVTLSRQRLVLYAVIAALLALGVNQLIGLAWFRPRPFAAHQVTLLLPRSPDPSFPSDHAAGGFALGAAIVLARDRWTRRLGGLLLVLAALLAFSRVYAGTHYPFDVIAGAAIGSASAALVWLVHPFIDRFSAWGMLPVHRLTAAIINRFLATAWYVPAR